MAIPGTIIEPAKVDDGPRIADKGCSGTANNQLFTQPGEQDFNWVLIYLQTCSEQLFLFRFEKAFIDQSLGQQVHIFSISVWSTCSLAHGIKINIQLQLYMFICEAICRPFKVPKKQIKNKRTFFWLSYFIPIFFLWKKTEWRKNNINSLKTTGVTIQVFFIFRNKVSWKTTGIVEKQACVPL